MTPADLRRQLWQAATQYGADAWDAKRSCLRPEVKAGIDWEREHTERLRIVDELRAELKNMHNGDG